MLRLERELETGNTLGTGAAGDHSARAIPTHEDSNLAPQRVVERRSEAGSDRTDDQRLHEGARLDSRAEKQKVKQREFRQFDLTGKWFGRLLVLSWARTSDNQAGWLCRCKCGKEKPVRTDHLTSGRTISCGCKLGRNSELLKNGLKHGHCSSRSSRTYSSWTAMHARCRNPKAHSYADYGGRGISVCDRWKSFENFLADMGGRPLQTSIDRIDPNGNYEPGNCRWATVEVQGDNKRNTKAIAAFGETKSITEWSQDSRCVTTRARLTHRLRNGWSPQDAITTPRIIGARSPKLKPYGTFRKGKKHGNS